MIEWLAFLERLPPFDKRWSCSDCERAYRYKGKEPPCDTNCGKSGKPKPTLLPSNHEVAFIYNLVRGQVRTSLGGVVDLDYVALKFLMDLYQIEDQVTCFERVAGAFKYYLSEHYKNKEDSE